MSKSKVNFTIKFTTNIDPDTFTTVLDDECISIPDLVDWCEYEKARLEDGDLSVDEFIDDADIDVEYRIVR